MSKVALVVVACLFSGVAVEAAPPDPQLIAPIQTFIDAFNKGDAAGAASTHAATADLVYVVVPAVYAFKQRGVAMQEKAQMTFVLQNGPSGWLIHGWTWTGPKPSAVKP